MGNCICQLGNEQMIQHIITENCSVGLERNSVTVDSANHELHSSMNSSVSTSNCLEILGDNSVHELTQYAKEVETVLKSLDEISRKLENDSQPLDSSCSSNVSSLCLSNDEIQQQLESISHEMAVLLLQVEQLTKKANELSKESILNDV